MKTKSREFLLIYTFATSFGLRKISSTHFGCAQNFDYIQYLFLLRRAAPPKGVVKLKF